MAVGDRKRRKGEKERQFMPVIVGSEKRRKRRFLEGRSREGRKGDRGERTPSERDKKGGSEGKVEKI